MDTLDLKTAQEPDDEAVIDANSTKRVSAVNLTNSSPIKDDDKLPDQNEYS